MSESLKRVAILKIVGTIAIEMSPIVLKLNVSAQHLSIIIAPAVKTQLIGMHQVDPLAFLMGFFPVTFLGRLGSSSGIEETKKRTQKHRYDASVRHDSCMIISFIFQFSIF
jgi:hypothetical protein